LSVGERELGNDVVGSEIALKLGCVAGGEGYGGEVGAGPRGRVEHFDPLRVVDGVEPDAFVDDAGESERVAVELLRGRGIAGVEACKGDAGNRGAHGLLSKHRESDCEKDEAKGASHGTKLYGPGVAPVKRAGGSADAGSRAPRRIVGVYSSAHEINAT
jgi:hypothetical protein